MEITKAHLLGRLRQIASDRARAQAQAHALEGAMQAMEEMLAHLDAPEPPPPSPFKHTKYAPSDDPQRCNYCGRLSMRDEGLCSHSDCAGFVTQEEAHDMESLARLLGADSAEVEP